MQPGPVFVHAWWRSGSTYVWSRLRRDPSLKCFYEPLNERLATLDAHSIESSTERAVSRALRHPEVESHYFAEYLGLIRAGRLGYSADLAYARYLLAPGKDDPHLRAYVQGLVDDAAAERRRAALCFCRSQMRSAWMAARFPGVHVAQLRNPASELASFNVSPYFTSRLVTIAARLWRKVPAAFSHIPELGRQITAANGAPGSKLAFSDADRAAIFMLLWGASAAQALSVSEHVLDIDMLSSSAATREQARDWFAERGCAVEFADCHSPGSQDSGELAQPLRPIAAAAAQALRSHAAPLLIFDAARVAGSMGALSGASRFLLEELLRSGGGARAGFATIPTLPPAQRPSNAAPR